MTRFLLRSKISEKEGPAWIRRKRKHHRQNPTGNAAPAAISFKRRRRQTRAHPASNDVNSPMLAVTPLNAASRASTQEWLERNPGATGDCPQSNRKSINRGIYSYTPECDFQGINPRVRHQRTREDEGEGNAESMEVYGVRIPPSGRRTA
jgi:hypothetical protein